MSNLIETNTQSGCSTSNNLQTAQVLPTPTAIKLVFTPPQAENTEHVEQLHNRVHKTTSNSKSLSPKPIRAFFHNVKELIKGRKNDTLVSYLDDPKIADWIHQGYLNLSILQTSKSYPYPEIAAVGEPCYMEQLIELYDVLSNTEMSSKTALCQSIMDQAIAMCRNMSLKSPSNIHYDLSKLIYAFEYYSHDFTTLKPDVELTSVLIKCDELFNSTLNTIKNKAIDHYNLHMRIGLQSPELAARQLLIEEVSKIILTKNNYINLFIIPVIQQSFQNYPHLNTLGHFFTLFEQQPTMRHILKSMRGPSSPRAPANMIIHSTIKNYLCLTTPNSSALTVLIALLSDLRQGDAGSCFATFLAINMQAARPDKCIKDFISLLDENALMRIHNQIKVQYLYLPLFSTTTLHRFITISQQGKFSVEKVEKGDLWEIPGLISAAKAMGIENLKEAIETKLFKSIDNFPKGVTIAELIQLLSSDYETYIKGAVAYEAQISCPLLRAWENTIATMAETQDTGMVHSAVIHSLVTVVTQYLNNHFRQLPKPIYSLFQHLLKEELHNNVRILYDPHIFQGSTANDERSSRGGFILYDSCNKTKVREWQRVDNPLAFTQFSKKIISSIMVSLSSAISVEGFSWCQKLESSLLRYVDSCDYIIAILHQYNYRNQKISNILDHLDELKFTPWSHAGGNIPKAVLQAYLPNHPTNSEIFMPISAYQLLKTILQICLNCRQKNHNHNTLGTNPLQYTPVRVPRIHSFSLMLGHPSLQQVLDPTRLEQILVDGKKIANSIVTSNMRVSIIKVICDEIINHEKTFQFLNALRGIQTNISIKNFRRHLLESINNIDPTSKNRMSKRQLQLDTALYDALEEDHKQLFLKNVIYFADSSWSKGIEKIFFCFCVNPGNGKLELWESVGETGKLKALDQSVWLQQQEWEIYQPFLFNEEPCE